MLKGWSLIFYGTTQPINKNDPVSKPLVPTPINNSNLGSSQNPNSLVSKSGGKGNRKQQQQQKAATSNTSSLVVMASPRKNSKTNQKNQLNKNTKQRLTTPRPLTTLYFNKDLRYEFVNGVMSVNRPLQTQQSTTVRPNKLLNNNVDSKGDKTVYVKSPVKAPKQVKESGFGAAKSVTVSTTTKFGTSTVASGASKTAEIAIATAPPQPTPLDVDLVDSFQYTSNPNIPKMFQKYEKIQEFYPEFHPYVGAARTPTRNPSSSGGGKPSRDGSKSNYFALLDQEESSAISIASPGFALPPSASDLSTSRVLSTALLGTAAKKSPAASTSQSMRTQTSTLIASKNGKG